MLAAARGDLPVGDEAPAWSRPTVKDFREIPWADAGADPYEAVRA